MTTPAPDAGEGNVEPQGWATSLYNWGGSIISYASGAVSSYLGWEDLDVVDPNADHADKGAQHKDEAAVLAKERQAAWGTKQFQQYIGMDVTSLLSVPVWIMEPFTILQKAAEIMEYTELLDKANSMEDPYERFAWLAAYAVSPFGAAERCWKPFNPILGETFELQIGNNVKYLAEQVSHHPPICAAHAENENFIYDVVSAPTTRFLGNSLEVFPYGRTRIQLRKWGETYTLVPPNALVQNIVIGRTWVDVFGTLYLYCGTTGTKCTLEFQRCGWFSYGRYQFEGYVYDKDGKKRIKLTGKWNGWVDMVKCDLEGNVAPDATTTRLWTCNPKPENDYYGFTQFCYKLNSSDGIRAPMPSDSRRRPDRAYLAKGEMTNAGSNKYRLEEMQRAERREREKRGDVWTPRWWRHLDKLDLFPGELEVEKVPAWEFTGEYLKKDLGAVVKSGAEVDGQGFCPWQYPEIHEKL